VYERLEWARPQIWRPWLVAQCAVGITGPVLVQSLRARFKTLRSFHAARPLDTATYYRGGIEPISDARWRALVAECFLAHTTDPVLAAAIDRARDVQFEIVQGTGVHFCCDRRLILELDTYQLIYGSLSLLVVAARIDKAFGTDFKSVLRQRGRPSVFVCDVPLALIADATLAELLSRLIAVLRGADTAIGAEPPWDFRYSIASALPPAAVVGHHQPLHVPDLVYGHHIAPEKSG
jgi:hypothetical protein